MCIRDRCKEGAIPFVAVDPLSGSGPFGIHTSSGKLDPPLESESAGPTQICHEKLTNDTNSMLSVRGAKSDAVGDLNLSGDVVEEAGWGTDVYQDDAERLK